ncbi:FliM/FliN family flagellar motor switch protein [Candidatus Margulisiibacteriota bacterium]
MPENKKNDLAPQKRSLKLAAALGDWTTYKPARALIKRVKSGLYGFDRLSKEELEEAHFSHYRFGQKFFEALKKDLGAHGEVYRIDACQSNYGTFTETYSLPMLVTKLKLLNFHEKMLVAFDLPLTESIVNSALGGADAALSGQTPTETENAIFETTLSKYLPLFNSIFENNLLEQTEINVFPSSELSARHSIPANSSFIYFVIEGTLNQSYGKIIIGYSGKLVKSILKNTNQSKKTGQLKLNKLPKGLLGAVQHQLNIILGKTQINASDLNSIEIGDVISLDQSLYSALPILLGDRRIILGQPGIANEKVAIKIISVEKDYQGTPDVKIAPPTIETEAEVEPAPAEEEPVKPEEEFEEEYTEEEYTEEEYSESDDQEFAEEESDEMTEEEAEAEEGEEQFEEDILSEDDIDKEDL